MGRLYVCDGDSSWKGNNLEPRNHIASSNAFDPQIDRDHVRPMGSPWYGDS
jgi:hypothetical protein